MSSSHCREVWSQPFAGSEPNQVPFYPDGNATYWYYAISRFSPGDTTGLMLSGEFGHARYQSITVYDDETGNQVASLRDNQTTAADGSKNPYLLAVDRDTPDRGYAVAIVPEGSYVENYTNVITFPRDLLYLSIYLRVYLPDENLAGSADALSGGVPLPTFEAFDTRTGAPSACPQTRDVPMVGSPSSGDEDAGAAPLPVDGKISFYNLSASGFYGTEDNQYLTAPLAPVQGTVAVLRFKPPSYTDTEDPAAVLDSESEVRYWSFNICGQKSTLTNACLADYQAVVGADGYVNLVLGPPSAEVLAKAEGLNFLPWGPYKNTVVIYRNLVSNPYFPYANGEVPLYDSSQSQDDQAAQNFLGEYAPTGVQCSVEDFLENYGGVPVSFA